MSTISSTNIGQVRTFETHRGAQIYQIPLKVFPILSGYAYLVFVEDAGQDYRVLIDTGSGYGDSNKHLEEGLSRVSEQSGRAGKASRPDACVDHPRSHRPFWRACVRATANRRTGRGPRAGLAQPDQLRRAPDDGRPAVGAIHASRRAYLHHKKMN